MECARVTAGKLYREVMTEEERERLAVNIVAHACLAVPRFHPLVAELFGKVAPELGARLTELFAAAASGYVISFVSDTSPAPCTHTTHPRTVCHTSCTCENICSTPLAGSREPSKCGPRMMEEKIKEGTSIVSVLEFPLARACEEAKAGARTGCPMHFGSAAVPPSTIHKAAHAVKDGVSTVMEHVGGSMHGGMKAESGAAGAAGSGQPMKEAPHASAK